MLKDLFALFERLLVKPGTITRAVKYLGVSRSTLHRWREAFADPRAENTLAIDAFVRLEICLRLAEAAEGRKPSPEKAPPAPPPLPRKIEPQPELAAKDVFRTPKQAPFIPPGARGIFEYAASR
jgi:hypothetical protein